MSVEYTKYSLQSLIEMNNGGKLVLPNFQREFVWDENKQRGMLSSFLVGLPIGSILNIVGQKGDFASRRLCENKSSESSSQEREYLLDGQQRISCLYSIFSDIFADVDLFDQSYNNYFSGLKYRWFININNIEIKDILGLKKLKFNQKEFKELEPDDVMPVLATKKIWKSKGDNNWYHPKFKALNQNGEQLSGFKKINFIADAACEEGLVPLYELSEKPSNGLHNAILKKLARKRIDEIEAEIKNGDYTYFEILGHIDPEIQEKVDNGEQNELTGAWLTLSAEWSTNVTNALSDFLKNEIPVIQLPKKEIGRAISVFSSINEGGMKLDVYDLIVARSAQQSDEKSLTERIIDEINDSFEVPNSLKNNLVGFDVNFWNPNTFDLLEKNRPSTTFKKHFLNALSLYVHKAKGEQIGTDHMKMNKILSLKPDEINDNLNIVLKGLKRTYLFLHTKCGLIKLRDVSYELMALPIFNIVINDDKWNCVETIKKIEYWYWLSLFSGRFRELQNTRAIEDLSMLEAWLDNSQTNPFLARENYVLNDFGYSDYQKLAGKLEAPAPGAMKSAILQFILSDQPVDFLRNERLSTWDLASKKDLRTNQERVQGGEPIYCEVDSHHILPLAGSLNLSDSSARLRENKKHILNSPLNYTYILSNTNRKIGSKNFSDYKACIVDAAKGNHFLPDFIGRGDFSSDEEYYDKFLNLRYEKIRIAINTELSKLRN